MSEFIDATSGGSTYAFRLDFEAKRWASKTPVPPEADFPFVVHVHGKRYELYSDETFGEVAGDPD